MNKFKFYFILSISIITIFSCSKDDGNGYTPEPLRDYQEQYESDIKDIEEYLNTYYITVTDAPGQVNDRSSGILSINAFNFSSFLSCNIFCLYPFLLHFSEQ